MRRFKTAGQAKRFLTIHAALRNLFRFGRHLTGATQSSQQPVVGKNRFELPVLAGVDTLVVLVGRFKFRHQGHDRAMHVSSRIRKLRNGFAITFVRYGGRSV